MELRNITKDNESDKNKEDIIEEVSKTIRELQSLKKNSKKGIHSGHRGRLKSQFLQNGLTSMTDIQKLELLLFFAIPQKDTNPIAHNLLDYFGSLKNVVQADYNELMKVSGIKENSALLINLINCFNTYCHRPDDQEIITSSEEAIEFAKKLFHGVSVEQFYVICLSKSGIVQKFILINTGTSDEVRIQIRTITQIAIETKVNRIIICHNHPNGPANMSEEDLRFTYTVLCSCLLNSIDLLDHIIIGTNGELSLYEANVMKRIKKRATKTVQLSKELELFLSASTKEYKQSKTVHLDYLDDMKF